MRTIQPKATPRTRQDQPLAVVPNRQGQETTHGPTGQTPLGRKVSGQQTVEEPGADGVETGALRSKSYRPNDA